MKQRLSYTTAFLAMIAAGFPYAVKADSKGVFDMELFSLSKQEEDAFDAPAAVYVITSEDIRRSGATVLPEVLRMAPGLQVAQQGSNKWAVGSRGFNFQFTNDLLVLVDGRTIYTPQFSGVVWDDNDIPLENIEKIEVIRGPGATVWGANAFNGVINIITKNAALTQGDHVVTSLSTNNDKSISIRHGGKIDNSGYYRAYAKRSLWGGLDMPNGLRAADNWQNNQAGFRADWSLDKQNKYTVEGDLRNGSANNYFSTLPILTPPYSKTESHPKEFNGAHILAKAENKSSEGNQSALQFYVDYIADHTGIVDRDGTTFDFDYQNISELNSMHQLTWGTGYRYIIDEIKPDHNIVDYRIENRNNSLYSSFLQDKIGLIPEKLYLTAGSKFEHNDYTGFEVEPSIKLSYFPNDKQTLWGSVTRAVRTPSRGESDIILRLAGTSTGYVARIGNPKYDSEELIAYEVGYRIRPHDTVILEATAFYNVYDKLRTFDANRMPAFGNVGTPLLALNNGTGESEGFELNSKWQVSQKWRLQANYNFLNIDLHRHNGSTDQLFEAVEGQAAKNQFGIHSFYNILPALEFDTNFYFVDNLPTSGSRGIDAYTRADLRLGWRPNDQVEISLLANNAFVPKHAEFQSSLFAPPTDIGRSFFIKMDIGF